MAEIEFSAGSLSVVDDWLGTDNANDTSESTADANVQSDEEEGQKRGREARLGLGAKFLPGAQSKVVYTAEQKMINKLKGKSTKIKNKEERREQELMRAQQEEEGEESRTSSVSKSDKTNNKNAKKKKKKKKKDPVKKEEHLEKILNDEQLLEAQSASQAEADLEEAGSKIEMQSQESNKEGGNVSNETKAEQVSATENPELAGTDAENSKKHWEHNRGWSGFAPQEARKRKKTRSKQKNMKKDNRPTEKKPTYLDPSSDDYDPYRGGTRKSNLKDRRKKLEELKELERSLSEGPTSAAKIQTAEKATCKTKQTGATGENQHQAGSKASDSGFFIDKRPRGASLELQLNGAVKAAVEKGKPKPKGKRKYKNLTLGRNDPKHRPQKKNKHKPTST